MLTTSCHALQAWCDSIDQGHYKLLSPQQAGDFLQWQVNQWKADAATNALETNVGKSITFLNWLNNIQGHLPAQYDFHKEQEVKAVTTSLEGTTRAVRMR